MKARVGAGLLLFLGLAQMAGDLLKVPALKGIAAATCASPAPKVFSSVEGLETFSTGFFLEWRDRSGAAVSVPITPELYARLEGPYNRRNVYGAILAFGPVLAKNPRTQAMFEAVLDSALCGERPLLKELGLDARVSGPVRIRLVPRLGLKPPDLPLLLEATCPP